MGCCSSNESANPGVVAINNKPESKIDKKLRKVTFCVCGLDNAGKTTICNNITGRPDKEVVPTFGLEFINVKIDGWNVSLFGLGGGASIRDYWSEYYDESWGVIYVVDSADTARLEESRAEFAKMAEAELVLGKPILVYSNKKDLPTALTAAEVSKGLGLEQLASSSHHIHRCCAIAKKPQSGDVLVSDPEIIAGVRWLLESVEKDFDPLSERIRIAKAARKVKMAAQKVERDAKLAANRARREAAEEAKANGTNEAPPPSSSSSTTNTATSTTTKALSKSSSTSSISKKTKTNKLSLDIDKPAGVQERGGIAAANIIRNATPDAKDAAAHSRQSFTEPIGAHTLPGVQKSPVAKDSSAPASNAPFFGVLGDPNKPLLGPLKKNQLSYSPPVRKRALPPLKKKRRPSF